MFPAPQEQRRAHSLSTWETWFVKVAPQRPGDVGFHAMAHGFSINSNYMKSINIQMLVTMLLQKGPQFPEGWQWHGFFHLVWPVWALVIKTEISNKGFFQSPRMHAFILPYLRASLLSLSLSVSLSLSLCPSLSHTHTNAIKCGVRSDLSN